MQTVWKGAISFGLVHVPVRMYTAIEDKDIHFRTLHKECSMPISHVKTCKNCEREIAPEEIIKAYEYENGSFVTFKPEELEDIKLELTKLIKIVDFVDLTEIDPIYFNKAYYLSPDLAGSGAYNLLLEAIKKTGKIGIAKVSIRNKSSLAVIRVIDNCICMETMHYPDEIRARQQIPHLPEAVHVDERELMLAVMLIDQLSAKFEPEKYIDDYRIALIDVIQRKISGSSMDIVSTPSHQKSSVIDLMAALQASLEERQGAQEQKAAQ